MLARAVHFICYPDRRFIPPLAKALNNDTFGFHGDEHLFLTSDPELFGELRPYARVQLVGNVRTGAAVNTFAPQCERVILHAGMPMVEFLKIRKKNLAKTVWRTWGGCDATPRYSKNPVKRFLKRRLLLPAFSRRLHAFEGIGCAGRIDEIAFRDKFGKRLPAFYFLPYFVDDAAPDAPDSQRETTDLSTLCTPPLKDKITGGGGQFEYWSAIPV